MPDKCDIVVAMSNTILNHKRSLFYAAKACRLKTKIAELEAKTAELKKEMEELRLARIDIDVEIAQLGNTKTLHIPTEVGVSQSELDALFSGHKAL